MLKAFTWYNVLLIFSDSATWKGQLFIIGQMQFYSSCYEFDLNEKEYKETIIFSTPLLEMGGGKRE